MSSACVCFISYVVRANSVTELFLSTARELGIDVREVELDFIPAREMSTSLSYLQGIEKILFKLTLKSNLTLSGSVNGDGTSGIPFFLDASEGEEERHLKIMLESCDAPC